MTQENVVHTLFTRHVQSEREYLVSQLEQMRADGLEATGGDLQQVTLNLGLLFDDIERLVKGEVL